MSNLSNEEKYRRYKELVYRMALISEKSTKLSLRYSKAVAKWMGLSTFLQTFTTDPDLKYLPAIKKYDDEFDRLNEESKLYEDYDIDEE